MTGAEQQQDGIVLDDGTWVDVGPDGRWRPSPGERARAAVLLGVGTAVLLLVALVLSVGGGGRGGDVDTAVTTPTVDEEAERPAPTDPDLDPSSIDGEPASSECAGDDRGGQPLRDRRQAVAQVLNGTSRGGHAGAVSMWLEGMGYEVATPGNAGAREITSVGYLAGWCAEAERAAEDLGLTDATVEPVPPELLAEVGRARLVVSLGDDSLGE